MVRSISALGLTLVLSLASPTTGVSQSTTPSTSPTVATVAGGLLGASLGRATGEYLGRRLSEGAGVEPSGDDPGHISRVMGGLALSVVGAATATHFGARVSGQTAAPFGRRLTDAIVGLATGVVVSYAVNSLVHGEQDRLVSISFSATQGIVAGLINARR